MARRGKKDFCLKCDTADRKKIGKGKTCKVCESELAINPYFGTWEPYTKLKPFWQVKAWLVIFSPVAVHFVLESMKNDNLMYLPIALPIVGFVFWNIFPGLVSRLYNHPGWGWLECPKCKYYKEDSVENFGTFLWNRVMSARCPKCGLKFEVENMAERLWPYDDEPFEGKIFGDPAKIRVKPKTIQINGRKILGTRRFLSFGLYQFLAIATAIVAISYSVDLLVGIFLVILIYIYRVFLHDFISDIDIGFDD